MLNILLSIILVFSSTYVLCHLVENNYKKISNKMHEILLEKKKNIIHLEEKINLIKMDIKNQEKILEQENNKFQELQNISQGAISNLIADLEKQSKEIMEKQRKSLEMQFESQFAISKNDELLMLEKFSESFSESFGSKING